jgi:hypothetical protein
MTSPLDRANVERLARIPIERWSANEWIAFQIITRYLAEGGAQDELVPIIATYQRRDRIWQVFLVITLLSTLINMVTSFVR